MGILRDHAERLHRDFHRSGAKSLDHNTTLEVLELLTELAMQVEHLTYHVPKKGDGGT
jgi:hypothetical protein